MAQVGSLYKGEIRNWKVLGGPDKPVSLYGRQSNSGTYTFMQEHVLGNKNYSPDVKEMNGNAQIIEGVLQDEAGVGYVGVGYLFDKDGKVRKGLKVLNISKTPEGQAYSPLDKKSVDSGDYPIARPLYQAVNGKPGPPSRPSWPSRPVRKVRRSSRGKASSPSARRSRPITTRT